MSAADARTRLLAPGTIRGIALLLCATGVVGMIVTSIADNVDAAWDEEQAAGGEDGIQRLVDAGADEDDIRTTVRAAIQLGRRSAGD